MARPRRVVVEAWAARYPVIAHYIDGEARNGRHALGARCSIPATGAPIASVGLADAAVVARAVAAAKAASPSWADTAPLKRARVMFRFKQLLDAHFDELAALITREHGKVLADAKGELMRGLEIVEFACGIPQLLKGQYSDNVGGDIDNWSLRQPVGVCVGITPFNFPAMVPMWMFPLAIACGNTFVLKPSERDPSTALALAQLIEEAGLPKGVLNVVHGDREAVDCAARASRRGGRQLRRLDGRRRAHLYGRHAARQTRASARRRQEPHGRDAGRRLGPGRRCADRRGLRLGRRALHGDLRRRRRRPRRRRARREARGSESARSRSATAARRARTWGR